MRIRADDLAAALPVEAAPALPLGEGGAVLQSRSSLFALFREYRLRIAYAPALSGASVRAGVASLPLSVVVPVRPSALHVAAMVALTSSALQTVVAVLSAVVVKPQHLDCLSQSGAACSGNTLGCRAPLPHTDRSRR